MASVFELSSTAPGTVNASTTAYFAMGDSAISSLSTEVQGTVTRRSAGVASGLYFRCTANALSGSSTLTSRQNLGAGAQSVLIGAGLSGEFQDTTNTDTFASGDQGNYKLVTGTGTNITFSLIGIAFSATSGTVKRFVNSSAYAVTTANNYVPLSGGQGSLQTTEAFVQYTIRAPGTLKNLYAYCNANTESLSCSVVSRLNGAPGSMALLIGAGLTGAFEDLVNSDTVVSGSTVNYASSVAIGSTGAITVRMFSAELFTATNQTEFSSGAASGQTQATSLTWFYALGGACSGSGRTVETGCQSAVQRVSILSNMRILLAGNGVSASSTAKFRKNGGNGNQTILLPANTSGLFEDTTNVDSVSPGDEINYQIVTGGSGTSLTVGATGLLSTARGWLNGGYWWQRTTESAGSF